MPVYLGLIVALFLSMLMIPALMRYAGAFGLIDVPDERKHHSGVIPRVGGIAIATGALAPVLVWAPLEPRVIGFLMAAALIVVFGVLDDRFALPRVRALLPAWWPAATPCPVPCVVREQPEGVTPR